MLDALEDLKADLIMEIREAFAAEAAKDGPPEDEIEATRERDQLERDLNTLKNEIRALSYAIQQTKSEIATMYKSAETESRMSVLQHDLDAVVDATEDATGRILEAVERIEHAARHIREGAGDPSLSQMADEIIDNVTRVFEASNFQDLTGQRLNKVVNTLKYVDERLAKIINIWGKEDIAELAPPETPKGPDDLDMIVERKAANIERVSQEDIDKLFD